MERKKYDSPEKFETSFLPDNALHRKAEMNARGILKLLKYDVKIYSRWLMSKFGAELGLKDVGGRFVQEMDPIIRKCLDLEFELHSDVEPLKDDERGLLVANHPSQDTLWQLFNAASTVTPNFVGIVKEEMLKLSKPQYLAPLLGIPVWLARALVPISRKDKEKDIATIREACRDVLTEGSMLLFMADAHRPKKHVVDYEREKFSKIYPNEGVDDWLEHTCFPRITGLMTILQAMKKYKTRIISSTIGASNKQEMHGTLHVKLEEFSMEDLIGSSEDFGEQEESLKRWLLDEWKRKNELISEWRS